MKIQAVRLIISVFLPVVLSSAALARQNQSEQSYSNSLTIVVGSGWNLLSLPLTVPDNSVSVLFPQAISRAFLYNYSYQPSGAMNPGIGYWLKFAAPETISISGIPSLNGRISLNPGWNLIGGLSVPIPINLLIPSNYSIITSKYLSYQSGNTYVPSDTLKPGIAYWVRSNRPGTLTEKCWLSPSQVLVSPADGAALSSAPVLQWRRSACSNQYHLQICIDSLFQTILVDTVMTDSLYHTTFLCGTPAYFWRVGISANGTSTVWSTERKYQTSETFTTLSPPDQSGESLTPLFRWTTNCSGSYRFQLAVDSLLATVIVDTVLASTSFQSSTLDSTRDYWWRVGINGGAQPTLWSPIRSFSATWRFIGPGPWSISAMAADPLDSSTMYVSAVGSIFKTTDAGITWQNLVHAIGVLDIEVNPINSQIVYANMNTNGVIKSTDGGNSWFRADSGLSLNLEMWGAPTILAIDPVYPDTLYAGTGGFFGGTVFKTTNGGQYWFSLYKPGDSLLESDILSISVDPENTNVVYTGTINGDILKTTDGGNSWQWVGLTETSGGNDAITYIFTERDTSSMVYTGTILYGLVVSSDGGVTWSHRDSTTSSSHLSYIDKIVGGGLSHDVYTSISGGIYQLDDGKVWKQIGFDDGRDVNCVLNRNTLFIGWNGVHKYLK